MMQELQKPRTLKKNEMAMHANNEASVGVIVIDTMPLHLPSRLLH
jgi:hypothetical protein